MRMDVIDVVIKDEFGDGIKEEYDDTVENGESSGYKVEHDETIEVGDSSPESDASSVDSKGELLDDLDLVLDQFSYPEDADADWNPEVTPRKKRRTGQSSISPSPATSSRTASPSSGQRKKGKGRKSSKKAPGNTPAKTRAQKRLNSFKKRSAEWAKGMRRNRNVSHFLDDIEVTMEKMKALGLRPLLFYGVYNDKTSKYNTKFIHPYSMSNETEAMLKKMNMLYNVLLQAWTPEDEGSRRGEKRKRKGTKGNQRPESGVERAAAHLRGEERAVEPPISVCAPSGCWGRSPG
ncbi:uncharacterized protein LOC120486426 isoform X2 [Pimephales promelas]|uniref:uncharacterized protein LOC120486426 isoform X2 n=1 Tax=Pimephales promelas TaxID=90988 RepID=UPI001955CED4|nr:uncharacterized protein LOC120486426 isoform X2 [Pimephales promelas]